MATGVVSWSTTAASNATADSAVNWAEGQSGPSVNNSSRAEMASVAKWYADLAGITTGGSATAYTVTTNQVLTALTDGATITIVPHTANGAAATLAVDGLTAKPLQTANGTALPTTTLTANSRIQVTYKSSPDAWIVHGVFTGLTSIIGVLNAPATTAVVFMQTAAPTGWTKQTTHNNKALRLVSGTISTGGSSPFTTVFGLTATDAFTLTTTQLPTLSTFFTWRETSGFAAGGLPAITNIIAGTSLENDVQLDIPGSSSGHAHNIDLRVQYVDVIVAIKDA